MSADDMFKNFTTHTCQGDWPIICRQITVSFFVICRQITVSFFVDWGHDCFVS